MPRRAFTLTDFDYALPPELVAQTPVSERRASRLLHVDGARLDDLGFTDLPSLLAPHDLLVLNDTRVIRARFAGRKPSGGEVEMLVERITGERTAIVQLKASHPPRVGETVRLGGGAEATVTRRDDRFFTLAFQGTGPLYEWLEAHGEIPLPPYIARTAEAADAERYQTVYARVPGAVAAPTAGLHFDAAMLDALAARGVSIARLTLHVGAGTFLPVRSEDLAQHRMHAEVYDIPRATADSIAAARVRGGRVVAVGTTTLRALEASAVPAVGEAAAVRPGPGETALFITPGYRFQVVDRLLTNFHLPKSTLLMLVSAFAGYDAIRNAYAHAVNSRYRFMSYGDSSLLERARGDKMSP